MSVSGGLNRHPSVTHLMRWFSYEHLNGKPRAISVCCARLADDMVRELRDGPELSAGLRKLLEAKDCFVRQALYDQDEDGG